MSADIEELRRRFFPPKSQMESTVFLGVVIKVDENRLTCTVRYDDSVNYHNVRLRAVINEKLTGLACIPKEKSSVLVCRIGHSNELFICLFSEIDKIVYTAGEDKKISFLADLDKMELRWGKEISATINEESIKLANEGSTFEMLKDKIKLNGGNEGLVKLGDLTEKLNDLVDAFNEHTHTIPKGSIKTIGEATKQSASDDVTVPPITSLKAKFKSNTYENTKILQ